MKDSIYVLSKDRITVEKLHLFTFIKQKDPSGSYSFFTTFNQEVVGNKQLFVAVIISLLCNLLFALSTLRPTFDAQVSWLKQIPAEWWVAVGLIVIGLLVCLPIKDWWNRAKNQIGI